MVTISARFVRSLISDTARPLRRFIRVINMRTTKTMINKKVNIESPEEGSM